MGVEVKGEQTSPGPSKEHGPVPIDANHLYSSFQVVVEKLLEVSPNGVWRGHPGECFDNIANAVELTENSTTLPPEE